MNALLLGSGGWIPTRRRETCCAYLHEGDSVLLIDAGTGVQRLVEEPKLLAGVEQFDIVLTHFHLDHVVGLSYLPALPVKPVLWGGGERLTGVSTVGILERLLGSPLFAAGPSQLATDIREIPEGRFDAGPFRLSSRIQRLHTDPTLALKVGDALTYCTDTAFDPANAVFAAGSRVLFHEAWYASDSTEDETHSAAGEAGRIAQQAGVERLVLIHVNPLQASDEQLVAPARAEFPSAAVGEDLAPITVS
jgi:ribonuclease BN (tRNA processing enzyme)